MSETNPRDDQSSGGSATSWIDVGALSDFPDQAGKEVFVAGLVIAVFRQADTVFALDGLCAHQGGPIAKGQLSKTDADKTCVTCPWHGWQYELDSGIQTVNRQPLQQTFPTRLNKGRVEVQLNIESTG